MKKRSLIILIALCVLHTGCNIINPAEDIPTYVQVDSFKFTSDNPGLTGTTRQSITSVWAYVDGTNIGVFDLPATIPVLLSKRSQLQLAPGVDNQGLKDYQLAYPFFSFYTTDLDPQPGKVINLSAETKYVSDLKFWHMDFEAGNSFVKLSGDTSIRAVHSADSVFEGAWAGCISLDANFPTAESIATINIIPGTQGYLEIHYRGNLAFQVGMRAIQTNNTPYSYLAGIKPKDQWGKFYVNIQPFTAQYPNALTFSVIIKASLEEGQTDGYVLLDNIKVISY